MTLRRLSLGCLALLTLAAAAPSHAADIPPAQPWRKADPAALARWQDLRFGVFIHWGPVSQTGKEIGWSRGDETPIATYDQLYKAFNPTQFDADAWAATIKASGARYVVLTTKHHDGFCLFDTKQTDYSVMHTPFGRDVTGELAAACRKQGLAFGVYYSVCDWRHPDFPLTSPGGTVKRQKSDIEAYNRYLLAQERELQLQYGPLLTLWNDVPQEFSGRGVSTIEMMRGLQPDILFNDRTGDGGDYATPEQRIGSFDMARPWESCMTLSAHNHWAWGGADDGVKPFADCLLMLVRAAGGNGNVLLNVGPRPDGVIDPAQAGRLREIGAWLEKYGESIYGTRGGPYRPTKYLASTRKDHSVYLHITGWPAEVLELPPLPARVVGSENLTGGTVTIEESGGGLRISVPMPDRQPIDTIVRLDLDRPAMGIEPITIHQAGESLTLGQRARASNVYQGDPAVGPEQAVDGDEATRWATDGATGPCWLEVDMGKPKTFDRAVIQECIDFGVRVKAFELQSREGDGWKTFYQGEAIGPKCEVKFAPLTAQNVRLNITDGAGGPTIWAFDLYEPGNRVEPGH